MWNDLRIRLRALFRRSTMEADLDDELRFHREQQTGKYMAAGLTSDEAIRRTELEFGGLTQVKEECRYARGITFLQTIAQDLRYSFRMLRQSPGFAAVVILTLAVGIGASTAIFSVVQAVLLRSLPVQNPQQLVVASWSARHPAKHINESSYGDCLEVRASHGGITSGCTFSKNLFQKLRMRTDAFTSLTAFAGPEQMNLTGNRQASIVRGELASGEYFTTLGVHAAIGRIFTRRDDEPGALPVVVLNYEYWRQQFGSDPTVIGRVIRLNGQPITIIGVADPRFTRLTPGHEIDLWVPLAHVSALVPRWSPDRNLSAWWLTIVGRLRPNKTFAQAQQIGAALFANEALHGPKLMWTRSDAPTFTLTKAQTGLAGIRNDLREPLHLLTAAVGTVLLITCANVAGLLLARGNARDREFSIRLAIGAERRRLLRQLLTESLLLSFSGALPGALLAYWGANALTRFFGANAGEPLPIDMGPTASVLAIAIGIATVTGVSFGLLPALQGSKTTPAGSLKEVAGTATLGRALGRNKWNAGGTLVVSQVALAVLVLSAAGLLFRTLDHLRSLDPGFDTKNVLLFSLQPSLAGYNEERTKTLYRDLQERLSVLGGVRSVSYSSDAILDGGLWTEGIKFEGQKQGQDLGTQMLSVGPSYFETLKIRTVAGRVFEPRDITSDRPVAIVNQEFVHQFLRSRNPLGVRFSSTDANTPQMQIIGVVATTKYADLRSENKPTAYLPLKESDATFVLRTSLSRTLLVQTIRKLVNDIDRNVPVIRIRTQGEAIDRLLFHERLLARLFSLFGTVGLFLACIGIYGLLSFEVARRTREWGIRTALGAQRKDTVNLILSRGLSLVSLGIVAGLLSALAANRLLESLLFGVSPNDPLTLISVTAALVIVGLLACWLPAQRAMKLDPIAALRYE